MLAQELSSNILPQLQLSDTVAKALQLMSDFKITHLPVVSEEKYLGLIREDDLLDEENKKIPIEFFQNDFIPASVNLFFISPADPKAVSTACVKPALIGFGEGAIHVQKLSWL